MNQPLKPRAPTYNQQLSSSLLCDISNAVSLQERQPPTANVTAPSTAQALEFNDNCMLPVTCKLPIIFDSFLSYFTSLSLCFLQLL